MSVVSAKQKQRNLKFIEVCFDGLHQEVERYLSEGVYLDSVDRNGYSAISEASVAGHTIVVGQLLRALANPNSRAYDGRTALHRAAFHGWQPVISLLLDNGADTKIRDESGNTPADLARSPLIRQQLNDFPVEKTREAQEERKRKLKENPPKLPQPEDDRAAATSDKADGAAAGDTAAFKPPPRSSAAAKAEAEATAKAEAKAKAVAKKKAAAEAAKAEKERRNQRYKEAMEELRAQVASGEVAGEEFNLADVPPPLVARCEVFGAGETRLNGTYQVQFATKDRVEFTKDNDETCQIFWSSWQDEWRMLIGDYKMGSTLYRNNYRPQWKADPCHGVPESNWQKWFGKDGDPSVRFLPDVGEGQIANSSPDEGSSAAAAETCAAPDEKVGAREPAAESQIKKGSEFLELHSSLNIVSSDDSAARRAAASTDPARSGQSTDIQLTQGGGRIVETADGLFGADEVLVEEREAAIEEPDNDAAAKAWLERTGINPEIPATWESIVAAKGTAQDLYKEEKFSEACQATTAAILAMTKFEALVREPHITDDLVDGERDADRQHGLEHSGHRPNEAEVESMRGVLHSNRSLLLQHQITANDSAVLAFGADAAWRLVVNDSDVALNANPTNFKASFRRARAFLELGELDEALQDATNVVDHYASTSSTPNPDAAALRERILDAIKKERGKWGEKGPRRWNRNAKDLVTEVSSSSKIDESATDGARKRQPAHARMPWEAKEAAGPASALPQRLPEASSKQLPAPRTGADIEKALLTTLKSDSERQLAYVREHLSGVGLRRFFKRAPLGPDLLARLICVSDDLAKEDTQRAEDLICALAAAPSAKTDAAMFDDEEQKVLQGLTSRLGPKAAEAWAD